MVAQSGFILLLFNMNRDLTMEERISKATKASQQSASPFVLDILSLHAIRADVS